jgi:tetratricopeptide (TPR) repeat protein
MKFLRNLVALVLLGSVATSVWASANPFQIPDELDQKIKAGLNHLYNLEFDEAAAIFNAIPPEQAADHPMVAFGKASVYWWKLSVYVLETDKQESKPFLDAVDECVKLSEAKIAKGDKTGEGYMTLGGVYGLQGRWQATNQEWLSAYFTGRKAIKYLRRAIKVNPEMKDAYMGLGMFDYYVAALPSVVRVLAFLGSKNDPQHGLDELSIAANEGTYGRTPSKLFLTEIYSNPENKPEKALPIVLSLKQEYPMSPFIHTLQMIIYYNMNNIADMKTENELFMKRIETKDYSTALKTQGLFFGWLIPFKQHDWSNALASFEAAIAAGTERDPFYVWSQLYKGYALDLLGKRDEAKTMYQTVLSEIRRWGSHDAAKRYLDKPFKDDDPILTKLVL